MGVLMPLCKSFCENLPLRILESLNPNTCEDVCLLIIECYLSTLL